MRVRHACALCASVLTASTNSLAALIDNGGGLIYDDVLDITWAQPDNTLRTWGAANAWAAGLALGGIGGWRLPYASVAAGDGPVQSVALCYVGTEPECRDNELGYMFYYNLSGSVWQSILDSGDPDLALFPSLQPYYYWSRTEYDYNRAYLLAFDYGFSGSAYWSNVSYTWVVHEGNVGTAPLPAALGLFVAGLSGLLGFAKNRSRTSQC